ncbi:MAG: hypothetical protein IAF94_08470 [Pirellulaceae bacterium]|nr:hypothetical protein [Pirellulaceae bacterium]
MRQSNCVRLHFGPYRTPRHHLGQEVKFAIRGTVTVYGVSKGRIPWPLCRAGIRPCLILCAGLVEAVRKESRVAVAHWWGVSQSTVKAWRRALGVPMFTPGSMKLRAPLYADPMRGKKIAAAKRGKARPPEVRAKIAAGHKRRHDEITLDRKSVK